MKAIILAAGMASRLRPLTNSTPKCMLKIGDRCLLERTFDALLANHIENFVVVTGYLQAQIVDFLRNKYPDTNIEFIHNAFYGSTNNIYSLWLTKESVCGEEVLLLDSDILFDPQVITAVLNNPSADTLALNRHELGDEEIKVIADNNGRVLEISKTCDITRAIGESVGIEKMSSLYTKALFSELKGMIEDEKMQDVFYEYAFERLINLGYSFVVEDTTRYFSIELDTAEDFALAKSLIPESLYK